MAIAVILEGGVNRRCLSPGSGRIKESAHATPNPAQAY